MGKSSSCEGHVLPFFMKRAPPRIVVLLLMALTFASVGVWLGTSWLLIAYGQNFLGTVGLRLLTLRLVLGFLGHLILLLDTFVRLLRNLIVSINSIIPLDCFSSSRISISHLKELDNSSRRI